MFGLAAAFMMLRSEVRISMSQATANWAQMHLKYGLAREVEDIRDER